MIQVDVAQQIWTITLDRPDKANALTQGMLEEVEAALTQAEADGAKAVVLTGAGEIFCAGADLEAAKAGLATDEVWERVSGRVAALPCLTIAALNGTLAGGAFGMVLACDLRLAVPQAKFFYPVMRLGFLPQPSDPGRLRALVGPSRAKMVLLAGAKVDADTALSWGLVDRIVPRGELAATVDEITGSAIAAKPGLCAEIKRMVG